MRAAEKRRANRYPLRMKARVQAVGATALAEPIETWTRDVSGEGLFLEFEQPLTEGTRMQLTLQLPAAITGTPVTIRCVSRVVRVVGEEGRKIGVGAVIEHYEFMREPADSLTT